MADSDSLAIPESDDVWPKSDQAISDTIGEVGREVLEKYSGIPPDQVVRHVDKIIFFMIPETKGWAMIAFPCFSRITFMHFDIPLFQNYPQILQRLREGEKFMDVGCGLGQQLRFLAYQGVSTENLFGVDISKPFVDLGYKLFKDSETFKATFILSDLLEPGPELDSVRGQISIMFAGFFFHLWDWDRQLKAAKHLVALLKPQKGSVIAGMQVGSMTHSGNWYDRPNPEYGPMFVHSLGSKLGGRQARIGK